MKQARQAFTFCIALVACIVWATQPACANEWSDRFAKQLGRNPSSDGSKAVQSRNEEPAAGSDGGASERKLPGQMHNEVRGDVGGEWDMCTHLKVYGLNFNVGLATFLSKGLKGMSSVLEFGCGLGLYVDYICRQTPNVTTAIGIEPMPMSNGKYSVFRQHSKCPRQAVIDVLSASAQQLQEQGLDDQFDLVYSIEVLEHIPRHLHDKAADFLVSRVGTMLVFSAAHLNQDGVGHIAERKQEEWVKEFTSRGLVYQQSVTQFLRRLSDKRNINHRQNLLVFTRGEVHPSKLVDAKVAQALARNAPSNIPKALWPDLYAYSKSIQAGQVVCKAESP
eukprot:m.15488 g.15488  ORF g.15488 m.15488 type:complete len:335 (-) comp6635_c0_seq1:123-1127(-)